MNDDTQNKIAAAAAAVAEARSASLGGKDANEKYHKACRLLNAIKDCSNSNEGVKAAVIKTLAVLDDMSKDNHKYLKIFQAHQECLNKALADAKAAAISAQ